MPTFSKILGSCRELSEFLPDIVFIGGVAVYLHTVKKASSLLPPESSHDADFMVSFTDYDILKNLEEVTPTPRLAKHQMVRDDVEFDIYVEKRSQLIVPYDEVITQSSVIERIRVACLEHLLVLKLEAFANRGHTSKGDKDRRDVAKIGLLLGDRAKKKLVAPYLHDELVLLLKDVAKSPVFHELASRNSHQAKKMRSSFTTFIKGLG